MHVAIQGKGYPRLSENCQIKKETIGPFSTNSEKFTVLYSNVDTLTNKL